MLSVSIPRAMIWPAVALTFALLGFVVVYGTLLQGRVAHVRRSERGTRGLDER